MNIRQQIREVSEWCKQEGLELNLWASCGIGRACVGVSYVWEEGGEEHRLYPDYHWFTGDYSQEISGNGDVWTPKDAYHKHPAVAVLVHDSRAEAVRQLHSWICWFRDNGFHVVKVPRIHEHDIDRELFGSWNVRLTRLPCP